MPDTSQDTVAWVAKLSRAQPATTFLAKILANQRLFAAHLRSPALSPGSIDEVADLARQVRRKSFFIKIIKDLVLDGDIAPCDRVSLAIYRILAVSAPG
jgi:hypothetical protein